MFSNNSFKNKIFKLILVSFSLLLSMTCFYGQASPVETFKFEDEATNLRFQVLSKELRCPKCQNQNLADSNSPIAADLRLVVYKQLQEGKSDQEIIDYMVYRYGDFVLYRPRVNNQTFILWFGPLAFFVIFASAIFYIVRKRSKITTEKPIELTEEEQQSLDNLLKK
tara:strand:- start:3530 stop:4030 length:501 start_codon:yes stop_codon:yes gene_type:complete